MKGEIVYSWHFWDIKISKPPNIPFPKMVGFCQFLWFWHPSQRNYNSQSFWITLYQPKTIWNVAKWWDRKLSVVELRQIGDSIRIWQLGSCRNQPVISHGPHIQEVRMGHPHNNVIPNKNVRILTQHKWTSIQPTQKHFVIFNWLPMYLIGKL